MYKIRTALNSSLPGKKAQEVMAPRPKIIEGIEGIHCEPPVKSAVMLLIVPDGNELSLAFIKRSQAGRYHGGQIAFPGGKAEPEDKDILATALRECQEEIGVGRENILVLGQLSDVYIPLSNYCITPIIGALMQKPDFSISPDEVEHVLLIRLKDFFESENKKECSFCRYEQQIIAPGYQIGEHFIWGATAMIISELEYILGNSM